MRKQTNSKRYLFQANAIAVSGQITHPFNDVIPVQAASALSTEGGVGSSRVDGFGYKEILSFASAYTEVISGESHEGIYETLSTSVVEKFNLLDVVTCDRIVARLTSKYPGDRKAGSNLPHEVEVLPIGSRFEGLRVANQYFERLEVAPPYFCDPEHACWTGLLRAVEKERKTLAHLSLPAADRNPAPLPAEKERPGVLGFCLAYEPKSGDDLGRPLRIEVPQFGTVHLGEFFCYPTSRSLTMLRVELGCTTCGSANAAAVGGGGRSFP